MEETCGCRKRLLPVCMALLSSFALLANATIPTAEQVEKMTGGSADRLQRFAAKLRLSFSDKGFLGLVLLLGLVVLYCYYDKRREEGQIPRSKSFALLAVIFAGIMVVGMSVQKHDSLAFILENKFQMIFSLGVFAGYFVFFYVLFGLFLRWLENRGVPAPGRGGPAARFLLEKHPLLGPFCFMFVCWLPYWIAYFPGSLMWDGFVQLNCFFGVQPWSNHHPVFSSCILGFLMWVGRGIGSDNLGIALCALAQHILLGSAVTFCLYRCRAWGVSLRTRWWSLLFFALCPIIAYWPQGVMKDVWYYGLFLWYAVLFLDLIRDMKAGKPILARMLQVGAVGLLASLTRHNGIYVVFFSLLCLALLRVPGRVRARVAAGALVVAVCITATSGALVAAVGASEGSTREALSIPFQQTARYVKEHEDEVTDKERAAIDGVLNYEALAECYDPDISDPVKSTYRGDDAKLPAYFKTWLSMFFKHPRCYLEATLSNCYSYFYPNGESTTKSLVYGYISQDERVNTGFFDVHYAIESNAPRKFFECILYTVKQMPGVGLLCHMGTYTWVLLLLLALALHKRRGDMALACLPAVLNLLICVASPVNGYLRYFLPNVLMTPLLLGWFLTNGVREKGEKRRG